MVQGYIGKKFKWNQVKTGYFLEKNNINSIEQLFRYDRFPHWEANIIRKTLNFKEYCQKRKGNALKI